MPQVVRVPPPPRTEVRNIPVMPGKTLTSRIIKPVGAAMLLIASLAYGQGTVISIPFHGAPADLPAWCAAANAAGLVIVNCPPYNAAANGVADDAPAINRALAAVGNGGVVTLGPGTYLIKSPLLIQQSGGVLNASNGVILQGSGPGSTTIISDTSGTGFSMIRSGSITRTCSGGAGSCDARLGRSGRGAGCYCQAATDCNSGTCTTGAGNAIRKVTVRDLALVMAKDNMIGLDAFGMNESLFSNLIIQTKDGVSHTNTVDLVLSDGNGAVGGYSNTVVASDLLQADICVWARSTGNAATLVGNSIKQGNTSGCGSGIVVEASTDITVTGNLLQTTKVPVCAGGTTCSGGYNDGATCAVATDCKEGDVVLLGNADRIIANHIEDSNNPHIVLGCAAVVGGPCTGGVIVQNPYLAGNENAGSGTAFVKTNVTFSNPPVILDSVTGLFSAVGGVSPVKFPVLSEPLPTCTSGSTNGEGAIVWDTTVTNIVFRQLCVCNTSSKWCTLTAPNCASGTSTTCAAS